MQIDMMKILARAEVEAMLKPGVKEKLTEKIDNYMLNASGDHMGTRKDPHTVEEAGRKFANVLLHNIYTEHFLERLETALENVEVGPPFKLGDGRYGVYVYFENNLQRDSMSSLKHYPQINLAYLYNDGVDHTMKQIFEWDKSTRTLRASNTFIPFTGFMEQSINDFMGNYGPEYNTISIRMEENPY